MQNVNKKNKGQLFKVGLFLLFIGIVIFNSNSLKKIKNQVFEEMRLKIFEKKINDENLTINNINTDDLIVTPDSSVTNDKNEKPNKITYNYIGELELPTIKLKRGFVAKDSKYNNINYNITIANEADYPDVVNGNFIIMAHSGNAYISYFDKLYQLQIGDVAKVKYQANTYTYHLVKTYTQTKTGTVAIYRNPNIKTLTLITCTNNDEYSQSIYIFEEG